MKDSELVDSIVVQLSGLLEQAEERKSITRGNPILIGRLEGEISMANAVLGHIHKAKMEQLLRSDGGQENTSGLPQIVLFRGNNIPTA